MNFGKLDLNLLVVFDAMMQYRNVTIAGRELGLSQPAMSHALLKMRKAFDDPLFVRVKSGMQPTPKALAMVETVSDVLRRIQADLLSPAVFDPESSNREFRIAMSDVGESFFTAFLIRALRSHGQHLRLQVFSPTPSVLAQQLESGDVDLAIGNYPDLKGADFYQQGLFTSRFVAIAAKDNPHLQGELTMDKFLAASHIDVTTPGRTQEIILRYMEKEKIVRKVPLQVSRFLSLLEIVPQSDLIAIVPLEAGELFRGTGGVTVHALPFESPTFRLRQHWHKRFHDDAAVRWLRALVYELFKETSVSRKSIRP
ncbi:PCP degradation transcriptional activation protein [compost metagenome]